MTLYKVLAWANYLNYNSIGIIGLDNSYPKDIYIDQDNSICFLERHAGEKDYLIDISSEYENIAAYIDELTRVFHHLNYFSNKNTFYLTICLLVAINEMLQNLMPPSLYQGSVARLGGGGRPPASPTPTAVLSALHPLHPPPHHLLVSSPTCSRPTRVLRAGEECKPA